jgi:uncharacterized membrane protein
MTKKVKRYGKQSVEEIQVKDSPSRSLAKAISWRVMGSAGTFLISFIIFTQVAKQEFRESVESASIFTLFEFVLKILLFYLHERMWENIRWGKYWTRQYWARRAWRRMYRRVHEERSAVLKN